MIFRTWRALAAVACVALVGAEGASAAPPLTTIQDVLYKADGTRFNGTLTISWNSFQAVDNSSIVMQTKTVKVQDGLLRVQLVPTTTGTPALVYSVTYNSDGRVQFQEAWSVPSSVQPLHVRDVRTSVTASTDTAPAAGADSTTVPESNVVGLIADLSARPLKSPSFAPGRTAVVDANGMIATAAGSPTDCVHVDGSSGPCGSTGTPSFVDGEAPTGIVDGSNTAFGLSAVPDPVGSLALYRNGMLQKIGQDYSLTGSVVTFVAAATPQPGDTLLASYRLNGDSDSVGTEPATSPQVLCSGGGYSTANASLSLLGTCSIPAGLLAPGDRVEIRFDFAHQGSAGAVSVEVDWGGTVLVHRDGAAADALIAGRGSAAILSGGAQLSVESWGTALPFAAAVANAADIYSAGLVLNFKGSVAQSADAVSLTNFTVTRIP
jgi:hypothetical protein